MTRQKGNKKSDSDFEIGNSTNLVTKSNPHLNAARNFIQSLNEFEKSLTNFPENPSEEDLDIFAIGIQDIESLLKDYQNSLFQLSDEEIQKSNLLPRHEFQKKQAICIVKAKALIKRHSVGNAPQIMVNEQGALNDATKNEFGAQGAMQHSLPRLSLPTFNGNFMDYLPFIDNFKSIVDQTSVSNSQKFFYLLSCVKEGARELIAGLPPSDENYNVALTLLDERFNKPKLIIQSYVKNIFELKTVTKTASSLREFTDTLNKNILCMRNMQVSDVQIAGAFFSHIIASKLDNESKEKFKMSQPNSIPSIDNTLKFLQNRVQLLLDIDADNALEKGSQTKFINNARSKSNSHNQHKHITLLTNEQKTAKCIFCSQPHYLPDCSKFKELTVEDRIKRATTLQTCKNCLKHPSKYNCKSKLRCEHCSKFHNTLLHLAERTESHESPVAKGNSALNNEAHVEPILVCNYTQGRALTLLSTAKVAVKTADNETYHARVLLDSASTSNLITRELAHKLNLCQSKVDVSISGVNLNTTKLNNSVNVTISALSSNYRQTINCLLIDTITTLVPSISFNKGILKIPSSINLADNNFNESAEIDILIGASHFYDRIGSNKIILGEGLPVLIESHFGYLVTGDLPAQTKKNSKPISSVMTHCCVSDSTLNDNVQKLWELENVKPESSSSLLSKEERECEELFCETVTRNKDGRIIVKIPWNDNIQNLGNSYTSALNRFLMLEKRLSKDTNLKRQYAEFMNEYETLGHMTKIEINQNDLNKHFFLPHHPVLRENAITTKLRVVFDGSAKSSTNISVNDCQLNGPVVQSDLFSILIRFREHPIAVIGDCEKLYRQILVDENDKKFQTILWRGSSAEPIAAYVLNTVTYGLKASSYLATKSLQYIAKENKENNACSARIIENSFYVDDFIYSGSDPAVVKGEVGGVLNILSNAGIPLRKFVSNIPDVLPNVNKEKVQFFTINVKTNESAKALGIEWMPREDRLKYKFSPNVRNSEVTKRSVLSAISSLFDPLGIAQPIIIRGKILIQALWQAKLQWDDPLPVPLKREWESLLKDLNTISKLEIPRCVTQSCVRQVDLHGFADASQLSYGACIYIRCLTDQDTFVRLLCAKSKVAPLKANSIPRLELAAAVLLAQLFSKIINVSTLKFSNYLLYTDSKVTLARIQNAPNKFKTFVANRVALIQELTEVKNWRHVPTKENPADIISRGSTIKELTKHTLWLNGPKFLVDNTEAKEYNEDIEMEDPELKITKQTLVLQQQEATFGDLINRFSKLSKLQRVFAYMLRISQRAKDKSIKFNATLSVNELNLALLKLVKLCQGQCFSEEVKSLSAGKALSKGSRLRHFDAFLDEHDTLRLGGRVKDSDLSYDKIHPILLPAKHKLTELILRHYHIKYLHCGSSQLLALVRDRFWLAIA